MDLRFGDVIDDVARYFKDAYDKFVEGMIDRTIEKLWPNNPMLACDSSCQRIRINIGEYLEADRDELYHLDYCGRSFFLLFLFGNYLFVGSLVAIEIWLCMWWI
ncbi:hypothetical protein HanRHA438_Chr08g0338751 [Helianthus annuus]|nr:hypothetical protein HanHA89_Chr08g0287711 [Helianthus annuus]KAJ0721595.1 hypothetical protein HanOQP8_Chr08g0277261 [Helianthus annuus]KAJ0896812.1 hypothetical protein HanRHA438_Chr08g0338751 [Helianthus annuus]